MTEIFFNESGYCIQDKGAEAVYGACEPKHNPDGFRVYDALQHQYLVLISALLQCPPSTVTSVYHHSRIVDEMNGAEPLTAWHAEARAFLRRKVLPRLSGIVRFYKQSPDAIQRALEDIGELTGQDSRALAQREQQAIRQNQIAAFKERYHAAGR